MSAEKRKTGARALESAQQLDLDLIVTDLSMPIMDGLEETRILKQLMPSVPVIVFTLYNDPFIEKEALSSGASAVISKSDSIAALLQVARSLFEDELAA
jgi:CheY-like chemotaxis protein